MQYTVFRMGGERVAVVLVELHQLTGGRAADLLAEMQKQLALPAVLVARDDSTWRSIRTYAEFDIKPYLGCLLNAEDADWSALSAPQYLAQHQALHA